MFLLFTQIQMVLIGRHGSQISVWKWNFKTIDYACFADLKQFTQKSATWIKCVTGKTIFLECYVIWQKGDIAL